MFFRDLLKPLFRRSTRAMRHCHTAHARRARPSLEALEDRVTPTVVGPIDSPEPVPIPLGNVKAGQTVLLKVEFSTTDNVNPNDRTENEPVVIDGPGYHNEIFTYGTQTVQVPITQDGEELTASIQDGDGDESATITVVQLVITSPNEGATQRITFEPEMPLIEADVSIMGSNQDATTTQFTWKADVTFDPADAPHGNGASMEQLYTSDPVTGPSITLNDDNMWHHVIQGGKVELTVSAIVDGYTLTSAPVHLNIRGDNPGPAAVQQIIMFEGQPAAWPDGTSYNYYTILRQIASQESQKQQFVANGYPKYNEGGDGGVGIMQLTPPYNTPTPDQVWNWQSNVLGGIGVFNGDLGSAASYVQRQINSIQAWLNHETQQFHLTSINILGTPDVQVREAIQNYNAGTGVHAARLANHGVPLNSSINGTVMTINWVPGGNGYVGQVLNRTDPLIVTTQPPSTITAGTPFGLVVTAENADGSVNTSFNGSVTVVLNNNYGTNGTLGGTLTVTAVNGVATFSGLTVDQPGHYYSLTATANGLPAVTTNYFNITDELVVTTQPPATITAGQPFGLVVSAEKGMGTVDNSFNGNVTVALSNLSGGADNLLGGTLTVPAVNGVATFSGLTMNQVGQNGYFDLEVISTGLPDTFTTILVAAAPATQLVVTSQPVSITAGAGFNVAISAEDANGNVDQTFNGPVTLALSNNPGGGTLGGTLTATAVNGVADFSGLTISNTGNDYTLQATYSGLTPALTNALNVTAPGVASQLVVSTEPPTSLTAGSSIGLVVTAEDGFGTVDTTFNGPVTVALSDTSSTAILGGTRAVTAVNGIATFSGLTLNQTGSYALSASSTGLAGAKTSSISVTAAAATQLMVLRPIGNIFPGLPFGLKVNANDPQGNIDSMFTGPVTLALANNIAASTLGGALTVNAINGIATFSGLTINNPGTGYTIQATSPGLTAGTSSHFDVTSDVIVVTVQPPSSNTTGSAFGLTVAAEDGNGNPDATFNGPVTVALVNFGKNPATLGGTLTATTVNGVATFAGLTLDQPGTFALTVTSNGLAGTATNVFTVTAVAARLAVITPPRATITAGAAFEVGVAAEDAFGNVDTSFNSNVTISLQNNPAGGSLGGTLTIRAVNGVVTFPGLTINMPAAGYTLQATANGLSSATTSAIAVMPGGAATRLVVTSQPPTSVSAGSGFGLVVNAEDDFGTVDPSFNGTVALALANNPGSTLGGTLTVTAVNGVATFSGLTLDKPGDGYSLSVTGSALATTTNPFNVTAASATQLEIVGQSSNVLSRSPFNLAVVALDPFGNPDPGFNRSVTLALGNNPGGSTLGGTLTVTAVNGVATFSGLTINQPASGYTVQATSSGLTMGTTSPFDVTNDQLVVTAQPPSSVTAGNGFALVVAAEDSSGNVDASFTGSVTVTAHDSIGTPASIGGNAIVTAVNGVASFSSLTLGQAGGYVVTATSIGMPQANTSLFNVKAAAATRLAVTAAPPRTITAGAAFKVQITAEDPLGNADLTFNGSVTIALANNATGGTLGGTLTATAVNGVATFSGLSINNPSSGYALRASANGLTPATTSAINVTAPGVATQLLVSSQPPSNVGAGSDFGLIITAEDSIGTVDTSFTGSVTVNNPNGSTPLGRATAVNGVATFTSLVLPQTGNYSLTAISNGLAPATTDPFNVVPLAATQLVPLNPFVNVLPGSPFDLTVFADDANNNVDPTFNGSVTLALANNPGGSTLRGTLTVTAINGLAAFTDLTINNPGIGYTLQATCNGLTTGATRPFDVTTDQLVTTQPPSTVATGSSFGLVVLADSVSGNVDTTFHGSVSVALLNFGSNRPTLGGGLTVTAVNGVATFSGLTINQPGNYALLVTSSGLGGTVTGSFNVASPASVTAPTVIRGIAGQIDGTGQWWVGLSTGSSFATTFWGAGNPNVTWVDVQSGDFNGDGKTDIVGRDLQTGTWWVGISTGSSFTISPWTTWAPNVTWVDVKVGDFDGDGRADIAGRVLESGQWWVAQSTGSSFVNSLWTSWAPNVTWVDVQVGDFAGTGMDDIAGRVLQSGQWWVAQSTGSSFANSLWATWYPGVTWVDVQVGDFNGDGRADIAGRVLESGQWWVGQSTGSSFTNSLWTTWSPNVTWVDVKVGDFTGNGKDDIVGRVLESGQWWVAQSTGSSFANSLWATWYPGVTWVDVMVGDFNGDGIADITGRVLQTGQWWTGISNGTEFSNTLWTTWYPGVSWVDVQNGYYS